MKYIKLFKIFESIDNIDYILKSVRDIFIELEDEGMNVDISYSTLIKDEILVKIIGKKVSEELDFPSVRPGVFTDVSKEFDIDTLRDYVDMLIDFLNEFYTYDIYFELFDKYGGAPIKKVDKLEKDNNLGSITIHIKIK